MSEIELVYSVSDFVAVFNQSIAYAYPSVIIEGEIENYKISKDKWLYFSLKDDQSIVRFFGTIYHLPGPLVDGLNVRVRGTPFLHPKYGFSINITQIKPIGEGSIKKASQLLEAKLRSEGIFDESKKRRIIYPPQKIGLITSVGSAAYHDFIKIIGDRWSGLEIDVFNVQVQGDVAPTQIISALDYFNSQKTDLDVIVLVRGGGSAEDLQAFNNEILTRSIAKSRIPTVVAIGHEIDVSLVELAADRRSSTPSNAAETLTPNKNDTLKELIVLNERLTEYVVQILNENQRSLNEKETRLNQILDEKIINISGELDNLKNILSVLNPLEILKRGYSIIRTDNGKLVSDKLKIGEKIVIETYKNIIFAGVESIKLKKEK
jgi:exodeoxyribonuclease VII large subunit